MVVAPARNRAVHAEPAAVHGSDADVRELARRRRRLAVAVRAPADDGSVGADRTCVIVTGGDRRERPGWNRAGRELTGAVPARQCPVGTDAARPKGIDAQSLEAALRNL